MRLIFNSGMESTLCMKLLGQFPAILEQLHWNFSIIQQHYSRMEIRCVEGSSSIDMVGLTSNFVPRSKVLKGRIKISTSIMNQRC